MGKKPVTKIDAVAAAISVTKAIKNEHYRQAEWWCYRVLTFLAALQNKRERWNDKRIK